MTTIEVASAALKQSISTTGCRAFRGRNGIRWFMTSMPAASRPRC